MKNLITFIIVIASQFVNAQHTVTGVFTDNVTDIEDVALYRIIKGEADYVKYADVENKQFVFSMDSLPAGNYRALYQNIKTGYVDFIYNNENVKFSVDSKKGQPSVSYLESRENQLLLAYNYNISQLQYKLDSTQLAYFSKPTTNVAKYQEIKYKIDGAQDYYEDLAKNDYCLGLIKATKRYNAPLPFTLPEEYLENIITHFFDYIDFQDPTLRNSMFIKSRLKDYVFYLHQTDDVVQQNELYIEAVKEILDKTTDDVFKEEVLRFFIPEFIKKENNKVLTAIVSLYKQLPVAVQDKKLIEETDKKARVIIGAIAPDIRISETETLHTLKGTNKYLIVFWSSTCSHCSVELPKVKEIIILKPDITVVAVGLEDEGTKENWSTIVEEHMKDWKNVIALGKWESKEAVSYDVNATPTYFILNKDKRIIAKPNGFKVLKEILE
ncbi:thioredoxin-like domain-containing protein [Wenyingzhuangia sp. chi5]|uniref:Thioredoxin-like domain-containing protein n=1 Tax=Wenyingzhuangia gilva TaxID=3057677 RepID=A0ABT8VPT8_9FLAO|nr:thioredoxin-like domain-containing protein [Wenyingzhuangia sp. chi5]MDO3693982.1 thioredoxin-like domain-containing protein [Wenyingzhuangia sp. chi5]